MLLAWNISYLMFWLLMDPLIIEFQVTHVYQRLWNGWRLMLKTVYEWNNELTFPERSESENCCRFRLIFNVIALTRVTQADLHVSHISMVEPKERLQKTARVTTHTLFILTIMFKTIFKIFTETVLDRSKFKKRVLGYFSLPWLFYSSRLKKQKMKRVLLKRDLSFYQKYHSLKMTCIFLLSLKHSFSTLHQPVDLASQDAHR